MVFLTALLVSGQYFEKRKALALGFIASGSGIATMVLPNVYRLLFDHLDFTSACLFYGKLLKFISCLFVVICNQLVTMASK